MTSTSRRKVFLKISISLGVLLFVSSILWMVGGAGAYGSPLTGINPIGDRRMMGFLLTGPMSLLPASVVAIWRPRQAGIWFISTALISASFAVLVMTPTQPDVWLADRELWSNTESLSFYIFKWSLALMLPFSLPMLAFGSWLLATSKRRSGDGN